MKDLSIILVFFCFILAGYTFRPESIKKDNTFEVYTPKDIIFFNVKTGKVFSESGNIDTVINNQNDLIEFIGIVTANQSDI